MANSLFSENKVNQLKNSIEYATSAIQMDGDMTGLVVQSVQAAISRQIMHTFEVGSTQVYYVAGRAKGQGTLQNVIGPTDKTISGIAKLGDLCNPTDLKIVPYAGCDGGDTHSISFKSGALTSVQISAQADNDIISGSWGFVFVDALYE